jgi:hypothetical protein
MLPPVLNQSAGDIQQIAGVSSKYQPSRAISRNGGKALLVVRRVRPARREIFERQPIHIKHVVPLKHIGNKKVASRSA